MTKPIRRIYFEYDSDIGPLDVEYDALYQEDLELVRIRAGGIDITQAVTNEALLDELDYIALDELRGGYEEY